MFMPPRKCHTVKNMPSPDVKNTGNTQPAYIKLREALLELGWTLEEAAAFVGCKSATTMWRYSKGLVAIDADVLIKICAAAYGTDSVRIVRSAAG